MPYVIKASGIKEPFDKQKVIRTCLKLGAKIEEAEIVANKIEKKVYNGIHTKKILNLIFRYLRKFKPSIIYRIDLRKAISLLKPKPDFEYFVSQIFKTLGYEIERNLILEGKCVEHEIDVIAKRNYETILIEVKHHNNPHIFTGMEVFLEVNSTYEDLIEGLKIGKHNYNFNKVFLVFNNKISFHAEKYANCKNINFICWNKPENFSLEKIVEENKLYPITIIKNLTKDEIEKFSDGGIVLLKQIFDDAKKISERTRINIERIKELQTISNVILS